MYEIIWFPQELKTGFTWERLAMAPGHKCVKGVCYELRKYSEYSPKKLVLNLHTCLLSKLNLSGF